MRDLTFLITSAILTIIIWQGLEIKKVSTTIYTPKELLEISTPISDKIDIEFLKSLKLRTQTPAE